MSWTIPSPSTGVASGSYSSPPNYYSPSAPSGSTSGARTPPETFDLSGAALGALNFASKAPGYTYERPLALVDALTGGNSATGQKGWIGQAEDAIKGIPVVGDLLQGASNVLDASSNLVPSFLNSRTAADLQSTAGMADHEIIPNTDWAAPGLFGNIAGLTDIWNNIQKGGITGALNAPTRTVGDLRQDAFSRGFTPQDVQNLASGTAGVMDFGHLATNQNRLLDAAGRMILDPSNLLLGTGAITKLAKVPETLKGVESVNEGMKAAQAAGLITENTFLGANVGSKVTISEMLHGAAEVSSKLKATGLADITMAAPSAMDSAAMIRNGSAVGATLDGLSTYLKTISRGVSPFASAYRKVAVGATVGQLGVEALDQALPDNTPISAPFEGLFDIAHRMEHDTPLSNNGLFDLWSAFHFPVRDVLSGATTQAKLAYVRHSASDIEPELVNKLNPGTRQTYQSRRAEVISSVGGQDSWVDAMGHFVGRLARTKLPDKNVLMESGAGSYLAAGAHTENVQDLVVALSRDALNNGSIKGRDVVQELHDWIEGVRGAEASTGGVKFQFTPELFYRTWQEYAQQSSHLSATWGRAAPVVVGLMKGLLPKEHLTVAQTLFSNFAKVAEDGHRYVSAEDARQVLSHYPSLYSTKYDVKSFFASMLTKDAAPIPLGAINQRLNKLRKDAVTLRAYMYPVEEMEMKARATALASHRGTVMDENGMPDPLRAPPMGGAVVHTPTPLNAAKTNTGFPASTVDHVRELRGIDQVRRIEDAVPMALDNAGYNVQSVTQGIDHRNGTLQPSYAVNLDPARTDASAALQVASVAARASGADYAVVTYVGDDVLQRNRLTANGIVVRWTLGGMSPEQAQAVADGLQRVGGHAHLNDTSGALQIAFRNGEYTDKAVRQLDALAADLARVFPDQALNGMLNPTHDPAWVQIVGNDTKKGVTSARRLRDASPDAVVTGLDERFRTDPRYIGARSGLSEALKPSAGLGTAPVAERPGFVGAAPDAAQLHPGVGAQPIAGVAAPAAQAIRETVAASPAIEAAREKFWKAREQRALLPNEGIHPTGASYKALDKITAQEQAAMRTYSRMLSDAVDAGTMTREDAFAHMRKALNPEGTVYMGTAALAEPITPASRLGDIAGSGGNTGQVLFLTDKDTALSAMTPKFDPKLSHTLPPEELAKVADMQRDLQMFHPAYELKLTPKDGTPYYPGQGKAVLDVWAGRQALGDSLTYAVWSKAASIQHTLLGKVHTGRLAADGKQALFNELLNAGATTGEVNGFMAAINEEAKTARIFGTGEHQLWQRGDALPPHTINQIARGKKGSTPGKIVPDAQAGMVTGSESAPHVTFEGFEPDVLKAIGEGNFSKLLDRTGSRVYRDLAARTKGPGQLGKLVDAWYGKDKPTGTIASAGKVIHGASHYVRAWYGLFRFQLDPRWHAMNKLEADMLGYARYGGDATRFGRAASGSDLHAVGIQGGRIKAGQDSISPNPVESVLSQDTLASGWRDARQLDGFIGRAFRVARQGSARDVLKLKAAEDPAIQSILRKFGGTTDEWAHGLDQMLYDFDTHGVKGAIRVASQQFTNEEVKTLSPLIQRLYEENQGNFEQITNMYHGNVNRSNMERLANHPLLYWPLSYQLKVTKWLFDFMTQGALGHKSNLAGAWTINRLYQQHNQRLRDDPGYKQMFEGNPEAWQLAGMLFPITPGDIGVSLSRITRYSGSALGAWLGFWEQDSAYPHDPANFAKRVLDLGPTYTAELLTRAWSQAHDKQ